MIRKILGRTPRTGLVVALAAVAIAGCGDGSDSPAGAGGAALSQSGGPAAIATPATPGSKATAKKKAKTSQPHNAARKTVAAGKRKERHERAQQRARKRAAAPKAGEPQIGGTPKAPALKLRERRAALAAGGPTLLKVLGFPDAHLKLDNDARGLTVEIPAKDACSARPGDSASIKKRFRKSFRFVRTVRVTVTGSDLDAYVAASCKATPLPDAPGKLVYSQDGSRNGDTNEFTVTARKWTVVFENAGGYFQAFVLKDGEMNGGFIVSDERGPGEESFEGAGTYKLRIYASGDWKVKVYG